MSILLKKFAQTSAKTIILRSNDSQQFLIYSRKLSLVPSLYDGEKDPAPKFFSPDIQALLKRLSRPDLAKVFRKRTSSGLPVLRTPKYKFLTTEELEIEVQQPIHDVLSQDPALIGYDTSKYIFTDISFGVDNEHRIIVERQPDGTLQSCDHDIRKRLNQVYFPIKGRKIREPSMFTDDEKFNSLLDRDQYEFVLDRACIQYEPDEPSSTRHFGPLVFYLTWHQSIDSLMLDLLQFGAVREAVLLIATRQAIHRDISNGDLAQKLAKQKYITANSAMKSQQELALQGFREDYQQLVELSRGLKIAHGKV
ncbi:hypothetical protein MSG28_003229 [Choristoneura fumiferana]|uniref:Uncharacterized protein n=1 Tax=Choristoneura fumiferana TaxID=7141 RepID=A0ACC0KE36_CHOFU|nr:hypothetical protein MSG28_003229 [Choristoneura fumiferana]